MIWIGNGVLKIGSKENVKYIRNGQEIPKSVSAERINQFIKMGLVGKLKEIKKVEPKNKKDVVNES